MTVILTQGQENGANAGQQYYYEDVREGHNIGYLGNSRIPVNSITFTPIYGPPGGAEAKMTTGAIQNYTGAHYSPEYQVTGNGTLVHGGWLRLGNKKCPTITHLSTGTTVADTAYFYGNVLPMNWLSSVDDEQPLYMNVGSDAGSTKNVFFQNHFYGIGQGYYGNYSMVQMNDGDEMFSKLPIDNRTATNTYGPGGGFSHSYKTGGSASYRGFHELAYEQSSSFTNWKPYINFKRISTTTVARYTSFSNYRGLTYLGTYGGYPYYMELSLADNAGPGIVFKVHSYNVDSNTMTQQMSSPLGASGTAVDNAGGSYDAGNYALEGYNSSVGYWKGPTKWMLSQGGSYRWLMFPFFTTADYPGHAMLRMDTGTNAVQYSGYTNSTAQPDMRGYSGNGMSSTYFSSRGMNPQNLGGTASTSKQPGLAAAYMDWHGVYDVNQQEYFGPDYTGAACANGNGIMNQMHSLFPSYGTAGRADGDSNVRHRRIYTWAWAGAPNSWTSGYANTQMFWKGFTTVPETPHNWVWLDEKRTLIAAMCTNNTYIYECRGYDVATAVSSYSQLRYVYYIGNTNSTGSDAFNATSIPGYNSAFTVPGFNGNPTARQYGGSFMGWVHVNTIPHRVVSMGIDKHEKIFAVTENMTSLGGSNTYGGNLHMWTQNTPFSVALGGNVTTDTITYSGSNIDKTLTIEALGIRGRNVKTKVQMEIVGTDAQFDNGTQSKEVTTSTGGTVSETITITGSSQFNIVANFGV